MYVDGPEVRPSALKHGISEEQIVHAVHHAVDRFVLDEGVTMIVGPDHSGRLLEVGVVDGPLVIHAMPARPKFLR